MGRLYRLPKKEKTNFFLFLLIFVAIFLVIISLDQLNSPKSWGSKDPTEEIRAKSRDIYQTCKNQEASCYEKKTKNELLDVYPLQQILTALYDYDTYFSCHAFTHFLGRALYRKLESIADAYSQIDFTCHGGAYHGVMEAYLDQRKTQISTVSGDELVEICSDSKRLTDKNPSQVYTECLHGFGHAFMFITNSDLPKSLAYCDRLGKSDERERCFGGAFMENSTSSTNPDHPSRWIKADDRFYPCTILADQYQNQCYFYQANYLIKEGKYNFRGVFQDCDTLSQRYRIHCILGLGANLAGFSRAGGIAKAATVCGLGQRDAGNLCIEGAVSSFMARYGGEIKKVIEFCHGVADSLKEICFVKLGYIAKAWWQEDKIKIEEGCNQAGTYRQACLGNSNLKPKYN